MLIMYLKTCLNLKYSTVSAFSVLKVLTHQTYGNRKSSNPQSSILSSEDSSLRVRVTEFETYGIFKIDSSVLNPNIVNTLIFPLG
jgi:hypothetical protein